VTPPDAAQRILARCSAASPSPLLNSLLRAATSATVTQRQPTPPVTDDKIAGGIPSGDLSFPVSFGAFCFQPSLPHRRNIIRTQIYPPGSFAPMRQLVIYTFAPDRCVCAFQIFTDGNLPISVWGMNFAACIRTKKSGTDANWTQ